MQSEAVVCEVRYRLDPDRLAEFEEYGRAWIRLIEKHGGVHYGFFMPRAAPGDVTMSFPGIAAQGADDEAISLYAFPEAASYDRYRTEVPIDPEGASVIERFASPPFKSYTRMFLRPVPGDL